MIDIASTIKNMELCGISAEMIVTALKCIVVNETQPTVNPAVVDEQAERRRAADRQRKAASNLRKSAEFCGNSAESFAKKEIPHTPLEKINNIYTHNAREAGNPQKPATEARGSRVPENFSPNQTAFETAQKLGIGPETVMVEIDKFLDYWRGVVGGKGRKLDWQATFRTWLRNSQNYNRTGSKNAKSTGHGSKLTDAFAEIRQGLEGNISPPRHGFADRLAASDSG